ncbi:MAG: TylF/MycF/NovP-related O-methyltransferase [Planctomycetota bacterium]
MKPPFLLKVYYVLTAPIAVYFILKSNAVHPAYRLTLFRKLWLGWRMFWNHLRIPSGSNYKSHLAMALKILETPPEVEGCVVECGTWKGVWAANMSLVCRITNRKLKIYDSFAGLPEGKPGDREAKKYKAGEYCGTIEEVQANIRRYGAIECCEFVKGWFDQTLPSLQAPVLLAFIDVDLEASLDTCVRCLWPHLVDNGYIFIDEFVLTDYCALFYSEKWWQVNFGRTPPGLIGAGTGLALGEYYIGPWEERGAHPLQHANGAAYTCKDMSGYWAYYPLALCTQTSKMSVPPAPAAHE